MIKSASNPIWIQVAVVAAALVLWALFLPGTYGASPWIFSWDSAAYIEAADSIRAGRGVYQRIYEGLGTEIYEPMTWWPPGFPMLIAFAQSFGLSAMDACRAVAGVDGAIGVAILALIALRLFRWEVALPLTATIAITVAYQKVSVQCMSDTSYFAVIAASLGCLIFWTTSEKGRLGWVFAAGVLAGASWATRNTGLAVFAASFLFIALHALWLDRKQVLKTAGIWAAGVAVLSIPLIAHNLIVLGAINAYYMPRSELSLLHNIRRAVQVVAEDLTTFEFIGNLAGQRVLILAGVALAAMVAAAFFFFRGGDALKKARLLVRDNRIQILLLAYAGAYAAVVILARTQYRWGEEIDPRHMQQIYWPLLVSLAMWGAAWASRLPASVVWQRLAVSLVCSVLVLLQVRNTFAYAAQPSQRFDSMEALVGAEACDHIKTNIAATQVILSSRADLVRMHCNANARKIPLVEQYYKVPEITRDELYRAARSGLLWGIVIEDTALAKAGGMGPMFKDFAENPDAQPGFVRVAPKGPSVLLEWRGEAAAQ